MRLCSILLAALVVAIAAPAALAASVLTGSSGPLKVRLTPPPTHTPKVGVTLPISVTATLNGKPAAHATAAYEFLFAGTVVSTQYPRFNKHFTFTGHFSDSLVFPAQSAGEPLALRFVIKAGGHTVKISWAITAHR